jgi:hypothetical protein
MWDASSPYILGRWNSFNLSIYSRRIRPGGRDMERAEEGAVGGQSERAEAGGVILRPENGPKGGEAG